jgi:hypothetical protein
LKQAGTLLRQRKYFERAFRFRRSGRFGTDGPLIFSRRFFFCLALWLAVAAAQGAGVSVCSEANDILVDGSVVLRGILPSGAGRVRVAFEYRAAGQPWLRTPWQRVAAGVSNELFRAGIEDLSAGVEHEFRAVVFARGRRSVGAVLKVRRAPPELDAFVIGGQSNAQGVGAVPGGETNSGRVWMLGAEDVFKAAYEPTHDGTGNKYPVHLGPGGHSAWLRMANDLDRAVMLVPCAVGSTVMQGPVQDPEIWQWILLTTNRADPLTLYGRLRVRAAMCGRVRAILWFGHESNTHTVFIGGVNILATFRRDWRTLMLQLQQDFPGVPVIYAQLARRVAGPYAGGQEATEMNTAAEHHRALEHGQQQGIAGCHMVVTFDAAMGDSVHLGAEGQRTVGSRFALAVRRFVYGEDVDATGPRLRAGAAAVISDSAPNVIHVRFDREINEAVNDYDRQFRVYAGTNEVEEVHARRGSDGTGVELFQPWGKPFPTDPPLFVTYGERASVGLGAITNVVRGIKTGLPAPQFRQPVAVW